MFQIGIVGAGQIANDTAEAIVESELCSIGAVVDIDPVAAADLAHRYDVPVIGDFYHLLEREDIDAVYLSVPHCYHAPYAIEAARSGKHIIVEKPMATDVRDAEMMVEAARQGRVKLSVALPMRFSGPVRMTRELLHGGMIGRIISTRVHVMGYKADEYWTHGVGGKARRSSWRGWYATAGGGILIMNAVHFLDAMLYATQLTVKSVYALGGTYASPAAVEDSIAVAMGYMESKAYGVLEASSHAVGSCGDNCIWIFGTEGQIRITDRLEAFASLSSADIPPGVWQEIDVKNYIGNVGPRAFLMDDLALAVRDDRDPAVSGEEGLAVTRIMLMAYRSMREDIIAKL